MAPLEVNQSTHISAAVPLDESTTEQINRYAALIHTCAGGDVVCKALNCCLRERPRPLNILQALHVEQVASMLCLRKGASNCVKDAADHPARRLASGVRAEGSVGVARALDPHFNFAVAQERCFAPEEMWTLQGIRLLRALCSRVGSAALPA